LPNSIDQRGAVVTPWSPAPTPACTRPSATAATGWSARPIRNSQRLRPWSP